MQGASRPHRVPPVLLRVGTLAVICGVLSGCAMGAERASLDAGMVGEMSAAEAAPTLDGQTVQPRIIVTGYLAVDTEDVVAATSDARAIVAGLDGRVDEESEELPDPSEPRDRTMSMRVRVPAASFTTAVEQFSALGTVTSRSITRTDVTLEVVDTAARVRTLTDAITRLRVLIADADSTADLIAAETALAERQAELDSLRAQAAYLDDQTSLATVSLLLSWREADQGWSTGLSLLVGAVVGAAAVAVALSIVRRLRTRRPVA